MFVKGIIDRLPGLRGRRRKVFGIGCTKTGTTTLGKYFDIIGYRHMGQRLDLVSEIRDGRMDSVGRTVHRHDAFEDWPWIILYEELRAWHLDSLFILTTRDSRNWIRSYRNLLARSQAAEGISEMCSFLYGLPFPDIDDEALIRRCEKHNEEVKEYFREYPGQFLVVNWEDGDGWPELCSFLDLPVPHESFPHANKGTYR